MYLYCWVSPASLTLRLRGFNNFLSSWKSLYVCCFYLTVCVRLFFYFDLTFSKIVRKKVPAFRFLNFTFAKIEKSQYLFLNNFCKSHIQNRVFRKSLFWLRQKWKNSILVISYLYHDYCYCMMLWSQLVLRLLSVQYLLSRCLRWRPRA